MHRRRHHGRPERRCRSRTLADRRALRRIPGSRDRLMPVRRNRAQRSRARVTSLRRMWSVNRRATSRPVANPQLVVSRLKPSGSAEMRSSAVVSGWIQAAARPVVVDRDRTSAVALRARVHRPVIRTAAPPPEPRPPVDQSGVATMARRSTATVTRSTMPFRLPSASLPTSTTTASRIAATRARRAGPTRSRTADLKPVRSRSAAAPASMPRPPSPMRGP